ncbi:hypothetical protein [Streptomyces olivochromogenes]|uniref:hypothetical protein n=1 Tax=Streptomyces olivochromogenes TaxID=1963 RepID=UPI0036AA7BA6
MSKIEDSVEVDIRTKVTLQFNHDLQDLTDTVGNKLGFVCRQAKGDLKNSRSSSRSRHTASKPAPGAAPSESPAGAGTPNR